MENNELSIEDLLAMVKNYGLMEDFMNFNMAIDELIEQGYCEDVALEMVAETWDFDSAREIANVNTSTDDNTCDFYNT